MCKWNIFWHPTPLENKKCKNESGFYNKSVCVYILPWWFHSLPLEMLASFLARLLRRTRVFGTTWPLNHGRPVPSDRGPPHRHMVRQGGRGCICLNSRWKWPLARLHLEKALTSRQLTAITLERGASVTSTLTLRRSLSWAGGKSCRKSHEMWAQSWIRHQRTSSAHLFPLIKQLSSNLRSQTMMTLISAAREKMYL